MEPDEVERCVATLDVPLPFPEEVSPAGPSSKVPSAGPGQYLVVLNTQLDDLPIAVFADRNEALGFADVLYLDPEGFADEVASLMNRDMSELLGIGMMEFGGPFCVKYTHLFTLGDE